MGLVWLFPVREVGPRSQNSSGLIHVLQVSKSDTQFHGN